VDDTISHYGRIDAVVSNMGHGGGVPEAIKTVGFDPDFDGPLLELTDELWHESLDMYVLNVVRLARIVTPFMMKHGGGAFVNISSMNASVREELSWFHIQGGLPRHQGYSTGRADPT
jgi:NAD(P)-dependent dehydrogenase (short-subunit alcohol dehydrogenase family)